MAEFWKIVKDTDDKYEISNLGNLRRTGSNKLIKGFITKYGYVYCNLRFNGVRKLKFRHVLVAETFIEKPQYKCEVNHKNGIKTDNRVENLEWCTRSENVQHAYDNGLKKSKKAGNHGKAKLILDLKTGIFYSHIKDAAKAYQIPYSTLVSRLNGSLVNNTDLKVV